MLKPFIFLSTFFIAGFFLASEVSASFITIKKDGDIILNVLSKQSFVDQTSFEIKKIIQDTSNSGSLVGLEKKDDGFKLTVLSQGELKELNVNDSKSLVEVEERPEVQRIVVGVRGGKISLEQEDVVALTEYPLQIDAKRAIITLTTANGDEFLYFLPKEVVEFVLRTKLINKIEEEKIEVGNFDGKLQYKISGEKIFKIANLFEYSVPIEIFVSGITGEITSVDSPSWFKILRFLFLS